MPTPPVLPPPPPMSLGAVLTAAVEAHCGRYPHNDIVAAHVVRYRGGDYQAELYDEMLGTAGRTATYTVTADGQVKS